MRLWLPFRNAPETRQSLDTTIADAALTQAATKGADVRTLGAVEACAGIYGRAFAGSTVEGTDIFTPNDLDMIGRSLLFKGEYVALVTAEGFLVPCSNCSVLTRSPNPMDWGYWVYYATPRGVENTVAPAQSVIHIRIGTTTSAPWRGRSPLAGAMTDAELGSLAAIALLDETKIRTLTLLASEPESSGDRLNSKQVIEVREQVARAKQGQTIVTSHVFKPGRLRPDPSGELDAVRKTSSAEIAAACGIAPVLLSGQGDGGLAREAYRRLVRGTIEPLGRILAHEASRKLGGEVSVSFANLRASDVAMSARAFAALVSNGVSQDEALKTSGLEDI